MGARVRGGIGGGVVSVRRRKEGRTFVCGSSEELV